MPHFHHLLARKIHQYRNQQCSLVNWLKQSQRMWHTYRTAYLEKNGLDWEIPYVFYRVFSSFFDFCARWLDTVEVLTSDQCALTEINHHQDQTKPAAALGTVAAFAGAALTTPF